jgi:hypothetical protein
MKLKKKIKNKKKYDLSSPAKLMTRVMKSRQLHRK